MGQEIDHSEFRTDEFLEFQRRLQLETAELAEWMTSGPLDQNSGTCGLELEAWLIDADAKPAPANKAFIHELNDSLVVPELASFNFELNTLPCQPNAHLFSQIEQQMSDLWSKCRVAAKALGLDICQIGVLPTLTDAELNIENISAQQRYLALNKQILRGRKYSPISIDIEGDEESLHLRHQDVMAEAATTSLQIHLQVGADRFTPFYNASMLASAAMVAACANSPVAFGKILWEESRIPLFEQAVSLPCFISGSNEPIQRVCFGSGFIENSIIEVFKENQQHFPILLPMLYGDNANPFAHLKLHNGTIWRWNRPLIDITDDGLLQMRIEHRVIPSGPTVEDSAANITLFYGLVHYLASSPPPIDFETARCNFYNAARYGLRGNIEWGNTSSSAQNLLLEHLIPAAKSSLLGLGFDARDIEHYIDGIILPRVHSGQTGAQWQRSFFLKNDRDSAALVSCYQNNCQTGPVHTWPIN